MPSVFSKVLAASAAAAAFFASPAAAHCPNACSGHGSCGASDVCGCWPDWTGADCSQRVCPFDIAWSDTPLQTDTAHKYAECSNKGVCDRETGECQCFEGYEGKACQRTVCPNGCSGHGVCYTLAEAAREGNPRVGGSPQGSYSLWDASKVQLCKCDGGWEGVDCSQRMCPMGNDPLTCADRSNQVQRVWFTGRPKGEAVFIVVDNHGTEWFTRPIRVARYVASEAISGGATHDVTAADSLTLASGGCGTTVAVGDRLEFSDAGGVYHYVTGCTSATVATFTPTRALVDDLTVNRAYGGSSAAQIEAAFEALPQRVVESVTVTLDAEEVVAGGSDITGTVANLAAHTGNLGVRYHITFNNPVKLNNLLEVDFCPCTTAGCFPIRAGLTTDTRPAIVYLASGTSSHTFAMATPSVPSACNTLHQHVHPGLIILTESASNVYKIQHGIDGPISYTGALSNGNTVDVFGGTLTFTAGTANAGSVFYVDYPLGVTVTDVTSLVVGRAGTYEATRAVTSCSSRGVCDTETGLCQCFSGYAGDDCSVQTTLV